MPLYWDKYDKIHCTSASNSESRQILPCSGTRRKVWSILFTNKRNVGQHSQMCKSLPKYCLNSVLVACDFWAHKCVVERQSAILGNGTDIVMVIVSKVTPSHVMTVCGRFSLPSLSCRPSSCNNALKRAMPAHASTGCWALAVSSI